MKIISIIGLNSCPMRDANVNQFKLCCISGGFTLSNPEEADIVLVWSCAFRDDVAKKNIEAIHDLRRRVSGCMIVTGCLPDILSDRLPDIGVQWIPWREEDKIYDKLCIQKHPMIHSQKGICKDLEQYKISHPNENVKFHDQFCKILISEGCPLQCSYCSEKLAFPEFKSFDAENILRTAQRHYQSGERNFMLMADCLGAYHHEFNLTGLIRYILSSCPESKFALHNFHPSHALNMLDDLENLKDSILHINLPIQSASDKILDLMRRGYLKKDIDILFSKLKPIIPFDTHVIVGFPGETEEDLAETEEFILKNLPRYVLLSAYFDASGTDASRMDQKLSLATIFRRLKNLGEKLESHGIICNYNDGPLSLERTRRIYDRHIQ